MRVRQITIALASAGLVALASAGAAAQDVVKIGMSFAMTGAGFNAAGRQSAAGARLFVQQHGNMVAGKRIELILRDDAGVADNARRLVQEMIVNDKVQIIAGGISGLLGIGSGSLKVPAMDLAMRMPIKVSTATSNFMIGVTAAASVGVYLNRGYIDPGLVMPVMLGVLIGSLLGARALVTAQTRALRIVFSVVIFALAIEMIYNGLTGRL